MPSGWGQRERYGEFRIVGAAEGRARLLGEGSFGKTFEAVRAETVAGNVIEESVALKVLNPDLLNSASKRIQFVQERTALTRLKHANLIHSIKCGEDNGEVYFAMELCMGGDLAKLVKRFGALPERVAALIGLQAAAGLREMHRREMVHRDIKPPNIMLFEALPPGCTLDELTLLLEENEGLCRIVDFGLVGAILNAPGGGGHAVAQKFVGSMMYASPEQILERKDIDGRTDIYALGMTLWYLVQGRGPLLDARGEELRHAIEAEGRHLSGSEHEAELPHNLSREFRGILARMVAKRPEERMPNAKELAVALERYLERSARGRSVGGLAPVQSREGLQAFFSFDAGSLKSIGRRRFEAEHSSTRQKARLTIVEDLDDIGRIRSDFTEVVKKVWDLAQNLHRPDVPATLLPVQEVIWAADALAYAEDVPGDVTLAEVLQARTAAKRPFSFREAEVIFRPVAEALDYLINHGWDLISLPCEEVWLSDPVVAAAPAERRVLCRPLDEWAGLRVRFSGMWVPPEKGRGPGAAISFASSSQGGSSFVTVESLRPPVSAFLRLVYRTLSGSDVPDAADRWQNGYISSVSLQNASNNLIRDLLCKQREWPSVSLILNELCANEGVAVDAPVIPVPERGGSRGGSRLGTSKGTGGAAGSAVMGSGSSSSRHASSAASGSAGRTPSSAGGGGGANEEGPSAREARLAQPCEIVSVGVVRMGGCTKELSALEWVTREFVKCEETGVWFFFPTEGRGLFAGRVERLKHVFSPYSGQEQEVEWSDWAPGREIICAATGHPFLLPQDLPLPTGRLPAEGTGRILSYFEPHGAPIAVAPSDWVPGAQITCPATHHVFVLPGELPPLEAVVDVRKAGWVSSPYEPEAAWTIPSTEWFGGRQIICNATRKPLTLPREVEQWVAEAVVVDAAAREVQSPYHQAARCIVPAMEWRRGGSVKCPPAGRPARLPMDLPLLVGQVVAGTPGVIRSPFSPDKITVPFPNWITGREVVCPKSGQPFLLPPGLPIPDGAVLPDKPGVAFSPYDPTRTVRVEPLHWVTGEVLVCPASGGRFKLPEKLPPLHAILSPGDPGLVRSPFAPETSEESEVHFEFRVPIEDWVAGNAFECPVTRHIFTLPPGIEEWIKDGSWVAGAPGRVRSPFRNGGEIDLSGDQWKPGALATCPETRRRFRVPVTEGFPSLALEKAAVQRARAEPEADEAAAVAALKKDHPGVDEAAVLAIWTRHQLETVDKRQPKEFGTIREGEPGFVTSPYNGRRMAVAPEIWVQAGASLLCESGKRFLLPPDRPPLTGTVDAARPGFVASPFAPGKPFAVKPWQWLPGKEIICEHSGHVFALPAALPAWVPQAVLDARKPGNVINPFSPTAESMPVNGQDWVPENVLSAGEGRPYQLPRELPPLVASLEKAVRGKVESPYAPGTIIPVKPDCWTPGQAVTCTRTKREFLLPEGLPDDPFEGIDPHDDGTIQSPYGTGGRFKVLALEWLDEGVVRCPETGKRVVLPKALPLLFGTVDPDRPREVRSPFDPGAWMTLAIDDWTEGREVTCAQTQRSFRLPLEPLPLPVAELAPGKPGAVRSPFRNGAEVLVPPLQWIEGAEVEDRIARKRFRLPKSGLPPLEGIPVAGRSLLVKSPFDPKTEVSVPLADWTPGHAVTCPGTKRTFVLPQHLDEPALPARLIEGRPGWIIDPFTSQEREVPGDEWNPNATLITAQGRKIILPAKLPPLPGRAARKSPIALAALTGLSACLLVAGGLAARYFHGRPGQTDGGGANSTNSNRTVEATSSTEDTNVAVATTPPVPPPPLAAAQNIEKATPGAGVVSDQVLNAYLQAYQTAPDEVTAWLVSNVARLTVALFEQAQQALSPDHRSRLISAAKSSDTAHPENKELAATAWFLDAEGQRATKGNTAPEVLIAYRQAATRNHNRAAEWLCSNVIAKPVPSTPLKVEDPFASGKTLDIAPRDWKAGQIIKDQFFKLSDKLPPLIAQFDSAKHHVPAGNQPGTIGDPYNDSGVPVEVDRKNWYRGAILQPQNMVLPNDLPLMAAVIDQRIMDWIGQRKAAFIASPVDDADISISWEKWKPGAIIKEKMKIDGAEVEKEVAVMPPGTSAHDPKLTADGATATKKRVSAASDDHRFEYTIKSPYTDQPVIVPVSCWVNGGGAPETELQKRGVQVTMLLPASGREVWGWISKLRTFSYIDETGQKDVAVPKGMNAADLFNEGFPDSAKGVTYRLDGKPRIYKNGAGDYEDRLTGNEYSLAELAKLDREEKRAFDFEPDVQAEITKYRQIPKVTSAPKVDDEAGKPEVAMKENPQAGAEPKKSGSDGGRSSKPDSSSRAGGASDSGGKSVAKADPNEPPSGQSQKPGATRTVPVQSSPPAATNVAGLPREGIRSPRNGVTFRQQKDGSYRSFKNANLGEDGYRAAKDQTAVLKNKLPPGTEVHYDPKTNGFFIGPKAK